MTTWTPKRLDELGIIARGRSRHRPRDAAHLYGGPYPFIQTGDVKHAELYITKFEQTYSEAGLEQSRLWPAGTLCITIAANIADTAILGFDACFPDSVIGFLPYEHEADTKFVKYLFDATIQARARQFAQGAAQENLSESKLLSIHFLVPHADVQKEIGEVLSAYDDLIENNRRRMVLLEEAARQLYREWFTRLRFPGREHTSFPSRDADGWRQVQFGDLCTDVRQAVLPDEVEPSSPYVGLEHMPRRSIALSFWGRAEQVSSTKFRFSAGDIIFGKIRPYFHKVGVAFVDGVASSDAIIIRTDDGIMRDFVLMTASSDPFVAAVSQSVREGSKMPRADWKVMKTYPVALPPDGILAAFSSVISPVVEQLRILTFTNQRLRAARDLLLPRLMSGDLVV